MNENTLYNVGHLFAGIDGFGIGLDAVGAYRTAFTVEFAEFPASILRQRLADDVDHFDDVRTLVDVPPVDVLTGGFPCQDLSLAGKGAGLHGSRSGLWTEYARIIGLAKPRVVLIENVPALLRRGFEIVVANLVELGYSVEWDCLPAAAFGAPHLRDRTFVVAHHEPTPSVFGEAVPSLFPTSWPDLPARDDGWQTWPRAGFVTGDELINLEPLAPLADVKAGGSVLPTPQASDGTGGRIEAELGGTRPSGAKRTVTLATAVAHGRVPTPRASDADRGGRGDLLQAVRGNESPSGHFRSTLMPTPAARDWKDTGNGRMGRGQLPEAVRDGRGLMPTPMTTDARGSRRSTARAPHWRGSPGDTLLDRALRDADPDVDAAAAAMAAHTSELARQESAPDAPLEHPSLWPTPKASPSGPDYARAGREGSGGDDLATAVARVETGQLNPDWVEWLMGFPLGWTNPDVADEDLVGWHWSDGEPPDVPRTALSIPLRRERLTALGNALVPAAAYWLGGRVLAVLDRA